MFTLQSGYEFCEGNGLILFTKTQKIEFVKNTYSYLKRCEINMFHFTPKTGSLSCSNVAMFLILISSDRNQLLPFALLLPTELCLNSCAN